MKTIPLEPVFSNHQFQELSPACKFFFIQAVYLLAQQGRLSKPPVVKRGYFLCSNPCYYQFKRVYDSIFDDVIPKICMIKRVNRNQTIKGSEALAKKLVKRRLEWQVNTVLSDEKVNHLQVNAVLSPKENSRYNTGMTDPIARKEAIENNKSGTLKLFTDN